MGWIKDMFGPGSSDPDHYNKMFQERMAKEKKEKEEIFDFRENVDSINERVQKRNADAIRSGNNEYKQKKNEEAEEKEKASDALKMVIDGAKLKCDLCTNLVGDLKVNFDTPTTQDKKTATVKEKDMKSLIFKGNCKKSPQSSSPCASVMQLGDWKDVGTSKIQEQFPLLLKSTIKCNYGGADIKITDCGQRSEPENIDGINTEKKQILNLTWMCTEMNEEIKDAFVGDKISLLVKTKNYAEGEIVRINVYDENGYDVKTGEKEITYSGKVQATGFAELKEQIEVADVDNEIKHKTAKQLKQEEGQKNEIHVTHEGKSYTKAEWKQYQDDWHNEMEKRNASKNKGFWG